MLQRIVCFITAIINMRYNGVELIKKILFLS